RRDLRRDRRHGRPPLRKPRRSDDLLFEQQARLRADLARAARGPPVHRVVARRRARDRHARFVARRPDARMKPSVVRLVAGSLALLAAGVWLGGIVVLGAVVAPTVFGIVPAPTSADAMTIVFTSFDKIAMTAAAIIAVCEVVGTRARAKSPARIDIARLAVIGVAGALAVVQGLWLSPTIVALHRAGAVRGSGELGMKLD